MRQNWVVDKTRRGERGRLVRFQTIESYPLKLLAVSLHCFFFGSVGLVS